LFISFLSDSDYWTKTTGGKQCILKELLLQKHNPLNLPQKMCEF